MNRESIEQVVGSTSSVVAATATTTAEITTTTITRAIEASSRHRPFQFKPIRWDWIDRSFLLPFALVTFFARSFSLFWRLIGIKKERLPKVGFSRSLSNADSNYMRSQQQQQQRQPAIEWVSEFDNRLTHLERQLAESIELIPRAQLSQIVCCIRSTWNQLCHHLVSGINPKVIFISIPISASVFQGGHSNVEPTLIRWKVERRRGRRKIKSA